MTDFRFSKKHTIFSQFVAIPGVISRKIGNESPYFLFVFIDVFIKCIMIKKINCLLGVSPGKTLFKNYPFFHYFSTLTENKKNLYFSIFAIFSKYVL